MRIDPGEFIERLKASPPGAAIVKDYEDQIAARRQKAIDENDEAQRKATAAVAGIRAKVPAADAAVVTAAKARREAEQRRMSLEAEVFEAEASANAVERRTRAELLETAPACIDAFLAEVDARFDALRLRRPNIDACVTPAREFLPASGISYRAHFDASGGRADAAALAVGHRDGGLVRVDLVRPGPRHTTPKT